MAKSSAQLFTPLTLRSVTIPNRVWVSPMCQYSAFDGDGLATDWHRVHYGTFGQGGAGLVLVEATAIAPEGRISARDLGLWNEEQRDELAWIAEFLTQQGTVPGIQLSHAGRKAGVYPAWGAEGATGAVPVDEGGWETVGPSGHAFAGLPAPRQLSVAEIQDDIVGGFVAAARRAVDAGFPVIELHAAHGYLLHSFLSPLSNTRTDEYGGDVASRARILLETAAAVRAEIGEDRCLFVRLSATDWVPEGLSVEDSVRIGQLLKQQGAVDLLDVSSGGNAAYDIPVGPGYQVDFACQIARGAGMPVGAVGMITDAVQAEHIVRTQQADAVLMGREMLRDPHFAFNAATRLGVKGYSDVAGQYQRAYRLVRRRES